MLIQAIFQVDLKMYSPIPIHFVLLEDRESPVALEHEKKVPMKIKAVKGTIQTKKSTTILPLPPQSTSEVKFSYQNSAAKEVYLAGDFNQWSPYTMPMSQDKDGVWRACIPLANGCYEYRFLVDGDWQNDPHACGIVPNEFGSCNCVVEVNS